MAVAEYAAQAGRYDDAIAAVRQVAALPGVPAGAYDKRIAELEAAKAAQVERVLERRALHGTAPGERGSP